MKALPLSMIALVFAGCASTSSERVEETRSTRSTTFIESGSGAPYALQMRVEGERVTGMLAASPADLWRAVSAVYRELGMPPTGIDSSQRLIEYSASSLRTIDGRRPNAFISCGSGPSGDYANAYSVTFNIRTQVIPAEGDQTAVRSEINASARDRSHSNEPLRCTTRGVLERLILRKLHDQTVEGDTAR